MRVLAVDWSGQAQGAAKSIWLAEAREGRLVALESGRSREQVVDRVIEIASEDRKTVVGFDFAFSFPAWWCRERSWSRAQEVWAAMDSEGEQLLSGCKPPFWGRPGKRRPDHDHYRQTELECTGSAKSVFQIGGAGAVGTGSVRGMPFLLMLARAGFHIWPFDAGGWPLAIEIYPRELTGKVTKSNPSARNDYLKKRFPELAHDMLLEASCSEDAFDAAVSALVMDRHVKALGTLERLRGAYAIEGAIWRPPRSEQTVPGSSEDRRAAARDETIIARSDGKRQAEPFCSFDVVGRPATFATDHEIPWKEAVRARVQATGVVPRPDGCFSVRIEFRTPQPVTANDRWDLDNLIKPTLDAMEGIFGLRAWKGRAQANDDQVVHLDASKRTAEPGESTGATIDVWLV